jgi:tetratricopeptide (TPR) repeat protein/tRNA A-37 threonylcarbamoyl transferase component Bud32
MSACLTDESIAELVESGLHGPAAAEAFAHLGECDACRALFARVADVAIDATEAAPPSREPSRFQRGERIGRYVALDLVGQGAMGRVYSVYDPELNRRVALKLLRPDATSSRDRADLATRLQREAQAMARLSHPNVVAVHDAGTYADGVFVAMDFVDGETLRSWLRREPRAWRAVLEAFLQAGRGLAAAHAAGIIHRDFKPDNVLVDRSGRVLVTDFGLARSMGEGSAVTSGADPVGTPSPLGTLTETGMAVGTPAYMAPEQRAGQVSPLADQYSFCVALYEALYGERPAANRTPEGARVPAWLRPILQRGLREKPEERFPSMEALIAALSRDPAVRRRRALLGMSALAVLIGTLFASRYWGEQRRLCTGAEREMARVWNASKRRAVQAAFAKTGIPYAADAWSRVEPALGTYAREWIASHTEACEATRTRGEQSEAMLDLRMQCLERRLSGVSMLLEALETADAQTVEKAVSAVHGLGDLASCAHTRELGQAPPPPDAEARARLAPVSERVARGHTLRDTGHLREARRELESALVQARELAYRPLEAEALLSLGRVWDELRNGKEAERLLHAAAAAADESRSDRLAALAKIYLVHALGVLQVKTAEALGWVEHAQAAIARLGGDPVLRARLLNVQGGTYSRVDRWREAMDSYRAALQIFETKLGHLHPHTATLLGNIGLALVKGGRFEEALQPLEEAVQRAETAQGRRHPNVGRLLVNLGIALAQLGKLEEARATLTRTARLQEDVLGPSALDLATTLTNLGLVLDNLGRIPEALAAQRRALAIRERALGPDHPILLPPLNNLALELVRADRPREALALADRALRIHETRMTQPNVRLRYSLEPRGLALERLGRFDEARGVYERQLAIIEKGLGSMHPDTAAPLNGIARVLMAQSRPEGALRFHRQALAMQEKTRGTKHPMLVPTLNGVARAELKLRHLTEALASAKRAVAVAEGSRIDANELVEALWLLAQIEWSSGQRSQARLEVRRALEVLRHSATPDRRMESQIRLWWKSHSAE